MHGTETIGYHEAISSIATYQHPKAHTLTGQENYEFEDAAAEEDDSLSLASSSLSWPLTAHRNFLHSQVCIRIGESSWYPARSISRCLLQIPALQNLVNCTASHITLLAEPNFPFAGDVARIQNSKDQAPSS